MGCITKDYKDMLVNMLASEVGKDIIKEMVKYIPLCEERPVAAPAREEVERVKRKLPEVWGLEPVYFDAEGKETKYSSPSALVQSLGLKVSGIQCDAEGKSCRATSVVEILRLKGYTVSGDGEPRKAAEGGKVLKVYHPDAPQLKEI